MPWGIVIPADEEAPLEFRLFGQYTELQEAVGGLFEAIDFEAPEPASFFVNEEGKLLSLPMNRRATLMWWVSVPAFRNMDVIAGDVVITGRPDEDGDTQDVPSEIVTLLMKSDLYKYEVKTLDHSDRWYGNNSRYDTYFRACNSALALLERWALATDVRVLSASS